MTTNPSAVGQWYEQYLKNPPAVKTYQATSAGTSTWGVNKDTETVEGRLPGLLAKSNPLMQQAATRGAQAANKRGLLNSSIGVRAGEAALYDYAVPIASNDAQTYARASEVNAQEANRVGIANAGFANDASRFGADAENQRSGMLFNAASNWGLEDKRQVFQSGENAADRQFRTAERVSGQEFESGQRAADRQYGTTERQAAEAFQAGQREIDREFTTQERQQVQAYETQRQASQNDFTARMQALQESGLDERQARQIASAESIQKLQEAGVQNRFDAQQALVSSQFSFEQAAIDRRSTENHARELERMGYANTLNSQNVPSQYAAQISSQTMNNVQAILSDPNLDPEAKKIAVQNTIDFANSTLAWASKFYETALPQIQAPSGVSTPTVPAQAVQQPVQSTAQYDMRSDYERNGGE